MDKTSFRREMKRRADALGAEERREQNERIFSRCISLDDIKNSKRVFVYVSVGNEVSTTNIIEKLLCLGKEVYVPLCKNAGEMEAVKIESMNELSEGKFNIPEPPKDNPGIDAEKLDVIIVPGVAFDRAGMRLGRGGGYYDRFLKRAEGAVKIALCREVNLENEVPSEPHDEKVDIIVSEKEIIKVR